MSTLHASQITTTVVQANNPVSSVFVIISENLCTICLLNFHTGYGKCVATVPLFSETSDKEFLMFGLKNLSFYFIISPGREGLVRESVTQCINQLCRASASSGGRGVFPHIFLSSSCCLLGLYTV